MPSHFLSGARLNLWERLLYKGVPVDLNSTPCEDSKISGPPTTIVEALRIFAKLFMVKAVGDFKKFLWTAAKIVGMVLPLTKSLTRPTFSFHFLFRFLRIP
ncbi:uncharacterized protein LOC125314761 [Rhodamnia argentea]|uniref:Uncharacterized protein LOC125314761 n=1 Tax=Rhodamnia argentea TaxID=178133 RepID=A0ABM3HAZ0_9MYRT|nr:uncharacterized protein LOC125314761 [Rhodamnia argentea]